MTFHGSLYIFIIKLLIVFVFRLWKTCCIRHRNKLPQRKVRNTSKTSRY